MKRTGSFTYLSQIIIEHSLNIGYEQILIRIQKYACNFIGFELLHLYFIEKSFSDANFSRENENQISMF